MRGTVLKRHNLIVEIDKVHRLRRQLKARSQAVTTPWDKKKLEALATSLRKNRSLLFKAEARMREEEQQR